MKMFTIVQPFSLQMISPPIPIWKIKSKVFPSHSSVCFSLCLCVSVSVSVSVSLSLPRPPFPLPSAWNHNQSFLLIPKQLLKPKSVRLGSSFPISFLVLSLMSQKAQIWGKTGYIWRNNLVFPPPFYSPIHIQV